MLPRYITDHKCRERATTAWFIAQLEAFAERTGNLISVGRSEADQMGYDITLDLNRSSHKLPIQFKCVNPDKGSVSDIHSSLLKPCHEMDVALTKYGLREALPVDFPDMFDGQGGAVVVFTWKDMKDARLHGDTPTVCYYTDFFVMCALNYQREFIYGRSKPGDRARLSDIVKASDKKIQGLGLSDAFVRLRGPTAALFAPVWFKPSPMAMQYQQLLAANNFVDPISGTVPLEDQPTSFAIGFWEVYHKELTTKLDRLVRLRAKQVKGTPDNIQLELGDMAVELPETLKAKLEQADDTKVMEALRAELDRVALLLETLRKKQEPPAESLASNAAVRPTTPHNALFTHVTRGEVTSLGRWVLFAQQ